MFSHPNSKRHHCQHKLSDVYSALFTLNTTRDVEVVVKTHSVTLSLTADTFVLSHGAVCVALPYLYITCDFIWNDQSGSL